jgi:hypothetical protein
MSSRATKLTLAMPMIEAAPMRRDEHYSPPIVIWGTLAFCLTVWGIVVVAVTQYV